MTLQETTRYACSGFSERCQSGPSRSFSALELPTDLLQRRVWLAIAYSYLPGGLVADQLWQIRRIDARLSIDPQYRLKKFVHVSEFNNNATESFGARAK